MRSERRSFFASLNSRRQRGGRRQRRGGELGVVFAANAEDTNAFEKEEEQQSVTTTTMTVLKSKQRQRDHRKRNRVRNKEKNDEVVREVLERFLQVLKPLYEEEKEKEESSSKEHQQLDSSFRAMYNMRQRRNEEEEESFSPPPNPWAMTTTTTIIDWSRFPKSADPARAIGTAKKTSAARGVRKRKQIEQIYEALRSRNVLGGSDGSSSSGSSSSSSSSSRSSKERKEFPRFKTCAVVGTSGTLKEKALGEQIDKHEAVIRTDLGRTVGFEKDVGARTTFDFAAANDLRNLVSNKNAFAGREEDDDVEPEDDSELENENEGAKMRSAKRRRRRNALHPQTLESIVARNSTIVLHELFSRAALRGTYPPFIRAFEQLRRSEEEKGGVRVDSGGVPSVAAIEPRLLVRILQTFHRVANALDQNSHETGAPSGARDISSSSRAPISIVATLFALQICDKVNAFGLAPPLAVQSSSSSSGKLDASSSGDEKIGRTRPTYRNYWDRNFAHVGTLKKHGLRDAGWEVARAIGQWPCSGGQLRVIDPKPTVKE